MNNILNIISYYSKHLLNLLEQFLLYIHHLFIKYKIIILAVCLPLFIATSILGRYVKIAVRVEDFGGSFLESFRNVEILKKEYDMEDKLTLIFHKKNALSDDDYCKIYQWVANERNTNLTIKQINSAFDLRYVQHGNNDKIFYPKIFSAPCNHAINYDQIKTSPLRHLFFTESLNDFTVNIQLYPSKVVLKHGIYDYKHVQNIIDHAKSQLPYEVKTGGTLFFQYSVLKGIDLSNSLNIFTALLFISGFYFFYRSKMAAGMLLFCIFFTNSILKTSMYLLGQRLDPLASCMFLMITIAIIEDYVFLSYLIFNKKYEFKTAIKKLILPSFLTSLTTAIGFGSLIVSPNPNIVHFAIWTSVGTMLEWFLIFIVLPCFYEFSPNRFTKYLVGSKTSAINLKFLSHLTPNKIMTKLLLIIFIIIPFIYRNANLNYSPFDMFDKSHEISKFKEYIKTTRSTEGEISVVFDNNARPSLDFLNQLRKIDKVSNAVSIEDFKSLLTKVEPSIARMIMADFESSSLGKLFIGKSTQRVLVFANSYDTKDIPTLQRNINSLCNQLMNNNCKAVSEIIVAKDYALGILNTLYESFIFCFVLIIIIILWLTFAVDRKLSLPILFSVMWAPIALLVFVIILQFKINVITCVALSIIVGLSGDNAIQFLLVKNGQLDDAVKDFGQASIQNFILLTLVSSTLVLSYFKTTRVLSVLMIASTCFMIIGDIWILNGLLKINTRDPRLGKNKNL